MAIKLNKKELEKLGIKSVTEKKNSTPRDRLKKAISKVSNNWNKDRILFNDNYTACILEINDTSLLSNNDTLRIDNRELDKLKKAWHKRICNLTKDKNLSHWENTKNKKILIEILYKPSSGKFLDPDAVCAAFKAPLDGLIEAGLIVDDNINYIPLIIPRQEKTKIKGETSLTIVLSELEDIDKYYTNYFKSFTS